MLTFTAVCEYTRLRSPAHSAADLSLPCRRVWRRAIHFFLVSFYFCGVQITKLAFPPGALLVGLTQCDREAMASSQLRTVNLTPPVDHALCWRKLQQLLETNGAIYDWAWSGNRQAMNTQKPLLNNNSNTFLNCSKTVPWLLTAILVALLVVLEPPTGQSWTCIHVYNFWTIHPIFTNSIIGILGPSQVQLCWHCLCCLFMPFW